MLENKNVKITKWYGVLIFIFRGNGTQAFLEDSHSVAHVKSDRNCGVKSGRVEKKEIEAQTQFTLPPLHTWPQREVDGNVCLTFYNGYKNDQTQPIQQTALIYLTGS